MVKTTAAYAKLAQILGSRIVLRSKTVRLAGEPPQRFTQTLLLLPKAMVGALPLPQDAEPYITTKSKGEFVAIVLAQTTPRSTVRVPNPPPNPMLEVRPIIGQGVNVLGYGWGVAVGPKTFSEEELDKMEQVNVRIVCYAQHTNLHYDQIVTQLALWDENMRLVKIHKALENLGTDCRRMGYLQAVAATEADAARLLVYAESGTHFLEKTDSDSMRFITASPNPQGEGARTNIQETLPDHQRYTPHSPTSIQQPAVLRLPKSDREALAHEFDAKEPK